METIELKKWSKYNPAEKKRLLQHWWYSCEKIFVTLNECKKFYEMVEINIDQVFAVAVAGYLFKISNEQLVCAIRNNKVDKLLSSLPIIEEKNDKVKNAYAQLEFKFISTLIESYYNPKPSIPIQLGNIVSQVQRSKKVGRSL